MKHCPTPTKERYRDRICKPVFDGDGFMRTDWFTRKFVRTNDGVLRFCNDHATRGPHKCAMEIR